MIYKDNFIQEMLKMVKEEKNNGIDSSFGAAGEGDAEYLPKDLQEELIRKFSELVDSEEVDDTDKSDKGEDEEEIKVNNIVTLTDERGEKVEFEFLSFIDYGKNEYVVLTLGGDEKKEEGEVVILQREKDDMNVGVTSYISVESEETLEAVFTIFKEKNKNKFDFID